MRKLLTFVAAILALGLLGARGQNTEDQYIRIYGLIQDGDRLVAESKENEAMARYQEARTYLQGLQKGNPGWNEKVVKFRLNYLARQIETLAAKAQPPVQIIGEGKVPGPGSKSATAGGIPELEQQVGALREQLKQLQGDKASLELKLKEALAVQPAAVDPRELAKVESRIQSLQKENELLKVTLDQEKARGAPAAEAAALGAAKLALEESNTRLASEKARADKLEQEKKALQSQLGKLTPSTWNAAEIEKIQKELGVATNQIKEQKEMITRLAAERGALQTRLKTISADAEAATALRQENGLLKKQLAGLKAASAAKGRNGDLAVQLAEVRAQVAALQSEKQVLQLERTALENRVKQLVASSSGVPAGPALPPPNQPEDPSRIKQLEKERRELEGQLAAARKELAARKGKTAAAGTPDLEKQVASLQARLQALEAAPGPYTAEELALFTPPSSPKPATPVQARPASATPPPGTSEMIAEARRFFNARQFDKAEETYREVLKRDENNAYTLANLASIQIETGKLEEAEKNVLQASAQAPDDPFTLSVLGHLRYRQAKYDEAFETFSRAAQLDPKNADIQNFLGVTLIQKGFRSAAQSAFRRAIQINPDYADAHYNLASACLGQTPPLVELARYHYLKAQATGFPRNEAFEKELELKKAK